MGFQWDSNGMFMLIMLISYLPGKSIVACWQPPKPSMARQPLLEDSHGPPVQPGKEMKPMLGSPHSY